MTQKPHRYASCRDKECRRLACVYKEGYNDGYEDGYSAAGGGE